MTVMMLVIGLLLACGGLIVMFWLGYIVGAGRCAADVRRPARKRWPRRPSLGEDPKSDEGLGPPTRMDGRRAGPSGGPGRAGQRPVALAGGWRRRVRRQERD